MMYMDLKSYYELNFALCEFRKWNIDFIENCLPYEREIYTTLLQNHLEKEEEAKKNK